MFIQDFVLLEQKATDNGFGGTEENLEAIDLFKGYLDMLGGGETLNYNSNIQESTHVLLTKQDGISSNQFIEDNQGNLYDVDFVDNPVGRGHHYEIYLTFIGRQEVG